MEKVCGAFEPVKEFNAREGVADGVRWNPIE